MTGSHDAGCRAWCAYLSVMIFFVFDVFCRLIGDDVTNDIQDTFGLNAVSVSTATGTTFFAAYAIAQMPAGLVLDRAGPRRAMPAAMVLAAVSVSLAGMAPNITIFVVGRALGGLACGFAWIGTVKVVRSCWGLTRSGDLLLGAVNAGGTGVGAFLAASPFGLLSDAFGWRGAFLAVATVPLVLAPFAFMAISDESHAAKSHDSEMQQSLLPTPTLLPQILSTPRIWCLVVFMAGFDAPFETFTGIWAAPFLKTACHWTAATATDAISLLQLVTLSSMLLATPVVTALRIVPRQCLVMAAVSVSGFIGFAQLVLSKQHCNPLPTTLALAAIGASQAGNVVGWIVASKDPLCQGAASAGYVAGTINAMVIFIDAMTPILFGLVLDFNWHGAVDAQGGRLYDLTAFSSAMTMFCFMFAAGCGSSIVLSCLVSKTN